MFRTHNYIQVLAAVLGTDALPKAAQRRVGSVPRNAPIFDLALASYAPTVVQQDLSDSSRHGAADSDAILSQFRACTQRLLSQGQAEKAREILRFLQNALTSEPVCESSGGDAAPSSI
eukprot:gnl/Ergobibamus_cyprinoides/2637.p3 GENE.gnl/Ergobibamus_cyprinoides/2637~~gnl/Ergobibamus_cyprinoides/2637.p3  ORF type:complete len:118 (+),score=10.83 gnl/Ergobibamus_cyprinoides/2637:844-1197(+)